MYADASIGGYLDEKSNNNRSPYDTWDGMRYPRTGGGDQRQLFLPSGDN